MAEGNSGSGSGSALYRPDMGAVTQSYNGAVGTVDSRDAGRCDTIGGIDESQLVRVPVVIAGDYVVDGQVAASTAAVAALSDTGGKRKRGRPPRGQAKAPPVKKMKMKEKEKEKEKQEEEDVCFICFDGGSLVLCDRRGCPKAYHPACIKRDEAFFQSKAKWNCGWHICSKCQKTSHYMCYTCTYSLCKGCTKDADYVSVRGDKGFCSICFKTIMLIENKDPGNKDMPQVDFDDKLSWEYLFKIYWVVLKQKLSLTLPELMQARSPWKEPAVTKIYKGLSAGVHNIYNNGKIPISNPPSNPPVVMKSSEETKIKEPLKILNGDSVTHEKLATDKGTPSTASIEVRAPQSNLDEYAAVDVHNISLIYLRRDLMANLFEDSNEKFHSKVTGSIVRIRVPSSDQEKDIHRLVKVIGTNKVVLPYKIGNKSLDVTLKVLNLGKQEDVSIDAISNNQDFSEEECIDLRQNIRRGLVERWTVVEIRAKAMSLQAAKFKDWVETEIMRFNQLRDQASEKGQTKEDCVERLQLLKSPEERRRRLCEAPEIHSDPKMHPNYGPEEDAVYSNGKKEDKEEVSPKTERVEDNKETSRSNTSEVQGNRAGTAGISSSTLTDQATTGPATVPVVTSETSTTPLSTESTPPANESEAEKLWHYRDLNGQTQGPFSMLQLQKWSASGFFPPDMRIWASDRQDDSVLLTDALDGQLLYNISVQFKGVECENINASRKDSTKIEDLNSNAGKDHHSSGNNGRDPSKVENNTSSDNDQTQIHTSVGPATSSVGVHATVNQTEKPQEMGKLESDLNQENWNNTTRSTAVETSSVQENHTNPSVFPGKSSGQNWRPLPLNFFPNNFESGDRNAGVDIPDLDSPAPKTSSGGWESQTAEENKQTSVCSAVPVRDTITVDLPILTLKMSNEDQNKHEAENIENKQQSLPMNFPVQESGPSWNNGTGVELGGDKLEITDKWGGYFSNTMPHEALGDSHVSSLSSKIDQLFHSPRSHPTSSWQMGFTERIEFSTLAEESVSDLLAEVDAMESQGGLPSPTSVMKCGEDLMQGPKHDYFSNMEEEFSPTIDPVKTEALTSTSNNIHLPSHSTIKTDIFDPIKGSSTTQSSTRAEVYRDSKTPTNFPSSQGKSGFDMFDTADISRKARSSKSKSSSRWDPVPHQTSIRAKAEEETRSNPNGSYVQFHAPFTMGQDLVDSVETHRPRTESMENDWLKMHQSSERSKADGRSNNRDGSSLRVPSPLNVSRKSGPDQMDVSWDPIHGNLNPAGLLGRSPQGITSPSYQGMSRGSGSTITTDHGVSPGSRGRDSQRKHGGGERLTSPRDRVSHSRDSRDSSRGGSKSSWSRQSSGSGGGGGSGYSSSRHPSRGQRVCKFYESGHCKKGALCDYFHP